MQNLMPDVMFQLLILSCYIFPYSNVVLGGRDTSWVTMTDELEFIQARKMPYDQALSLLKYDHVKYTTTVSLILIVSCSHFLLSAKQISKA